MHRLLHLIIIIPVTLFLIAHVPDKIRHSDPFEGEIHFQVRDLTSSLAPIRSYSVLAAPNRIWMESSHSHRLFAGIDANRFLARGDRNDFTFLNSREEGLQMTREELESLARLFQQMRGGNGSSERFDWERRAEFTGRTRTIQGYSVEEIRVKSDTPGEVVSVWLTDQIRIEWGFLEQVWHQSMSSFIQTDLPVELFMNRRSFPLLIEYIEDGRIVSTAEAVEIRKGRPETSRTEIPEHTKMMGMGDVMGRMIMGRR